MVSSLKIPSNISVVIDVDPYTFNIDPKDIEKKITNKKIIALGGISNFNLKKLKLTYCYGFAGISFFK